MKANLGIQQTFSSLRLRNYRIFWSGNFASGLSMQIEQVVRGWLVYEMSGSATALGLVGFAWGVPMVALSPFAGVVLDRVSRRDVLVGTQVALFLAHLLISILIAAHAIEVWHFVAVSLFSGFVFAFNMPGRQIIVTDLVEEKDLGNAIALSSAAMQIARVAGPALGGILFGVIGGAGSYFVMTGLYAVVAILLLLLRFPPRKTARPSTSFAHEMAEGLRYVRQTPAILALLLMAFVPVVFAMPFQALLPVEAKDVLGVGVSELGWLMAATGVGAVLGSLGVASLGSQHRRGVLLLASAGGFGVALVLLALTRSYPLTLLVMFLVGATSIGYMSLNQTLIQGYSAPHIRGRVVSLYMTTWGLMPVATLPAGAMADAVGVSLTFALGGAVLAVYTVATALVQPSLRNLR